ncbi:ion channel [Sphingomonas humi]|uniref:Potassium channel family protein n=1 Tax=Sphingomonas humi TaxID=335630 RepID=A0ABP7SEM9_9SPHN
MLLTTVVAVALIGACFLVHLWVLEGLGRWIYRKGNRIRHPLPIVLTTVFAAHLVEVVLYALGLSLLDWAGEGELTGAILGGPGWFEDHFYFSIASYTTLGIGDILPRGNIRIVAGLEALNGLVLVAWSASFTYLIMERLWGRKGPGEDI